MASSLSNLVNNLTEGIHKTKCKDCDCFLEYESVKDNLMKKKYLSCNKVYLNNFKKFENTFKFSNNDINNFFFVIKKRCLSL